MLCDSFASSLDANMACKGTRLGNLSSAATQQHTLPVKCSGMFSKCQLSCLAVCSFDSAAPTLSPLCLTVTQRLSTSKWLHIIMQENTLTTWPRPSCTNYWPMHTQELTRPSCDGIVYTHLLSTWTSRCLVFRNRAVFKERMKNMVTAIAQRNVACKITHDHRAQKEIIQSMEIQRAIFFFPSFSSYAYTAKLTSCLFSLVSLSKPI